VNGEDSPTDMEPDSQGDVYVTGTRIDYLGGTGSNPSAGALELMVDKYAALAGGLRRPAASAPGPPTGAPGRSATN
jgi:hypothetical protein